MTRYNRSSARGFTLLEILVALFIFAIIAVVLAVALHNVFAAKERVEAHQNAVSAQQIALLLLLRDTSQLIDLPFNSLYQTGAVTSSTVGTPTTLTFVENGFANPFGMEPRSTLQRVEYHVVNHWLVRTTWATLYPTSKDAGTTRELLPAIASLKFTYISPHNLHYDTWPPTNFPQAAPPSAILMTLRFDNGEVFTQVYPIRGEHLGF